MEVVYFITILKEKFTWILAQRGGGKQKYGTCFLVKLYIQNLMTDWQTMPCLVPLIGDPQIFLAKSIRLSRRQVLLEDGPEDQ